MFPIPEQFSAATKAQFEAQFEAQSKIMHALTKQAFDSVESLIALNISSTRAALEKSSALAHQLFAARGSAPSTGVRPAQPVLTAMLAHREHVPSTEAAKPAAAEKPVVVEKPVAKQIAKPAAAKTVAATKPEPVVAKAPAAKPAAAVKPAAAAKPAPVVKPVAVAKAPAATPPAAAAFVLPKKGAAPFPKSPVGK